MIAIPCAPDGTPLVDVQVIGTSDFGFWIDPEWLWDEDASEWVAYREWGLI